MIRERDEYVQGLISKIGNKKEGFGTPEERFEYLIHTGSEKIKKAILGRFGKEKIKSLDELSKIFFDVGLAESINEARELVPKIVSASEKDMHIIERGMLSYLRFKEVRNNKGEISYRINVHYSSSS